jgi:hypothetical protein
MRPYLKKAITKQKRAGGVAQGVGPEFKSQYRIKKQKDSSGKKDRSHVLCRRSALLDMEVNRDACCP